MEAIRITAGGTVIDRLPGFRLDVNRNGSQQNRSIEEVQIGDTIWVKSRWVKVTKVQPVYIDPRKGCESCSCFPAHARVLIKDKGHVPISHVTTGMCVLALDPSGKPVYSPVYLMAHADPSAMMTCVQIGTEGATLELSEGHFVVIVDSQGQERHVTARKVRLGHVLKVYDESEAGFRLSPVTSLGLVERRGRFAPLTLAGSVVVEGVAASCYEETCRVSPYWAHVLLAPVRWAWGLSPAALALLSAPRDLKGLPAWVSWLLPRVLPLLPRMDSG